MKQSVLIVHNDYQLAGGEGNVAENEARMLTAHGHSVTFYRRDNAEIASYNALQKLRLAFCTFFSFRTYREVRAAIRKDHIQIVHVHNTVPLISPSVYYAAWAEHVPVVQTLHNYRFVCPNGILYRDGHVCEACLHGGLGYSVLHGCYRHSRAQTLVLSGAMQLHRLLRTYKRIDAYIALTSFGKEKLGRKLPQERVYVKPNIVHVDNTPVPYSARNDTYVFLGRLDAEKGVWTLLHAFAKLPENRLIVVGSGPEEIRMQAYITDNKLSNVTMTRQLSHAEAIQYVAHARALVMPTQLYEGMPLTVLEAFAFGTPVIGSQIGTVGAIIREHGGGFLFDQTDADALVSCVQGCTQARLAAASEQALAASCGVYDAEQNYQLLCSIYENAAAYRGQRK